ncbi:NTP/NDP exchange transporter [Aggregicoccus sp. 17bor-14]|uniref:NTP/NDP exchange transporter n=1 Tax=Myxococcaceae TaxID=31 RepID=UPI003519EF3E
MLWSFAYFFCLMCGYAILKPLRDAMLVAGSMKLLSTSVTFSITFGAMLVAVPLYSALVARYPRHRVIPYVYGFFLLNLVAFYALMEAGVAPRAVARSFFVWASVYNLFVVSVFWSFMADLFVSEQGKRLFGFIAAGGTLGAILGPLLTARLVKPLGATNLLLVSAALLVVAIVCVKRLTAWAHVASERRPPLVPRNEAPVGGGVFAGFQLMLRSRFLLMLGLQVLLYTVTSTFLYIQQLQLVATHASDTAGRVQAFANIEFWVQGLTLFLQVLVTGRLLDRLGLVTGLLLTPVVTALGFLALAVSPSLAMLTVFRALRSSVHYAIDRPSREVLFTSVDREERYKSKSFIDTAVYRGGDLVSTWLQTGLTGLGLGLAGLALLGTPLAVLWGVVAVYLARHQARAARAHLTVDQVEAQEASAAR